MAMEHRKRPTIHSVLINVVGVIFFFWVVMGALPTGWIYDLGVGSGTEQGQKPSADVQRITKQENLEAIFFKNQSATIIGDTFVPCPLMRLRDSGQAGEHYIRNHASNTKRKINTPEYRSLSYPITPLDTIVNWFVMASSYNQYYLVQLEDGSYICAYFDDYLMIPKVFQQEIELPTGYIRYSTTEEKVMLSTMAEDYEVNPVYVLDMYRDGNAPWILDKALRLIAAILVAVVCVTIASRVKKMRERRR